MTVCSYCGNLITPKKKITSGPKRKFCDRYCQVQAYNKKRRKRANESCFNCRGTPNRNVDSDKVYCWTKQKWIYEFTRCAEYQKELKGE